MERFWAVCLYVHGWNPKLTDPQLFYFDSLTGLRWQITVPVKQTLEGLHLVSVDGHSIEEGEVFLGATPDGSRVLALVSLPGKGTTLLYVFAGSGELLRTLQFPDCEARPMGSTPWQLPRRPSGNLFVLPLRPTRPITERTVRGGRGTASPLAKEGSYLIDSDGKLVARFVDDQGQPIRAWLLSETHVLAYERFPDGVYRSFLYKLP